METLYSYSYIGILLSILLWDLMNAKKISTSFAKGLFFSSLLLYSISFFVSGEGFFRKMAFVLPRDVGIAVAVVFASHYLVKNIKTFAVAVLCLFVATKFFYFGVLQQTFVTNTVKVDPNAELLFDIKNETQLAEIKKALAKYSPEITKAFPELRYKGYSELDDYYLVNVADNYTDKLDEVIKTLFDTNAVDWAERNEIIKLGPPVKGETKAYDKISACVNDPLVPKQWAFKKMNMCEFYDSLDKLRPKKKAKIAILDTGVDSNHEDLKDNYISTEKKYDRDNNGHGTHCAGIAGAVTNNKGGVASFSPGDNKFTRVTSVKVLSDYGGGTQFSIIRGMIQAVDSGADVLSLSLGGPSDDEKQKAYEEVVKYAGKAGAIIVVAAGNSDQNAKNYMPAGAKGVIAVSAVDSELSKAHFSNYISDLEMGIAGPGVDIISTFPKNEYMALNGTSMAAPHVAGIVGIMKAVRPNLTAKQAFKILEKSGVKTKNTEQTGMFIQPNKVLDELK
ncbi:MAG: S8 family serine peptidase [Desulfobacterales bacterium]|nr:S8 family serine peptidase [Desulfobacterales bacterium]